MNRNKRKVLNTQLMMVKIEMELIEEEFIRGMLGVDHLSFKLSMVSDKIDMIHAYIMAEDGKGKLLEEVGSLDEKLTYLFEEGVVRAERDDFDELEGEVCMRSLEQELSNMGEEEEVLNYGMLSIGQLGAIKELLSKVDGESKSKFKKNFLTTRVSSEKLRLIERWLLGSVS